MRGTFGTIEPLSDDAEECRVIEPTEMSLGKKRGSVPSRDSYSEV
jgi:hypothetical protein